MPAGAPPPLPATAAAFPGPPTPLRIAELPPDPLLPGGRRRVGRAGPRAAHRSRRRRGRPLTSTCSRTGGLLVVGPPGSGRTAALDAFAADLSPAASPVSGGSTAGPPTAATPGPTRRYRRPCGLARRARGHTGVLLADDLGPAAEWPVLDGAAAAAPARRRWR